MPDNELLYRIKLDVDGKPEIVAATDEMVRLDKQAGNTSKGLGRVVDITDSVNARMKRNKEILEAATNQTNLHSQAELNLEEILKQANVALQENTYNLELARLEYESGESSQSDYVQRLRQIQEELSKQDAPSLSLIRRQREINKEISRLTPGLKNTAQGHDIATRAVVDLTRAARNAPMGLRSMSYGLQTSAYSAGRAIVQYGGVSAAIKAMSASLLLPPAGTVIAITALTAGLQLATSGMFSFGKSTRDYKADSDKFVQKIKEMNSELNKLRGLTDGGFLDSEETLENLRRFNLLETDIEDKVNDLNRLRKDLEFRTHVQEAESAEELAKRYERPIEHLKWLIAQETELRYLGGMRNPLFTNEQKELLRLYSEDLEVVKGEITNLNEELERTARIAGHATVKELEKAIEAQKKANSKVEADIELQKARLELFKELEEQFNKPQSIIEAPDIDFGPDVIQDALKEAQEFMKVERELAAMRLNMRMAEASDLERLELEKQARIEDINNKELYNTEQRERAKLFIEQEYAQKRADIQTQKQAQLAEELLAVQQRTAEMRTNLEQQTISAISAINQGLLGDNKAISAAILAVEKGLKIAQVITSGAQAAGQAKIIGDAYAAQIITPLGPNPMAIAAAANAYSQAAKIKLTTGLTVAAISAEGIGQIGAGFIGRNSSVSGGGGQGNTNYSYRMATVENENTKRSRTNENMTSSNTPLEVRLLDGWGNIVARGVEENDARGRKIYVREG